MNVPLIFLVSICLTLSACSSCDDGAEPWQFGETNETPGPGVTEVADAGRIDVDAGPLEPVLVDTVWTAMGCCDDRYYYFETKEPRCFEVHLRWAPDGYGLDGHEEVEFVPDDPFVSLGIITTHDERCAPGEFGPGEPVEQARGTIEVEPSAVEAELDIEVRVAGEESFRALRTGPR